jgi:hypothetical protein
MTAGNVARSQFSLRHCERKRSNPSCRTKKAGLLRRFAPRNDARHTFALSRRKTPEPCQKFSALIKQRAHGNAGCPVHPQPRVRIGSRRCTRVFTAVAPEITRHPRTQWFTAYSALSPEIGLSCLRRLRKLPSTNLTPASRRQDHTSSPSAGHALVRSATLRPPHPAPRP